VIYYYYVIIRATYINFELALIHPLISQFQFVSNDDLNEYRLDGQIEIFKFLKMAPIRVNYTSLSKFEV
jgi:hypothetical protein